MATMAVDIVAVEGRIWSGEATLLVCRTTEGDVGIMPGHTPLLAELQEGHAARIVEADGNVLGVAVHGGYLSVSERGVSLMADSAELASAIDLTKARAEMQQAHAAGIDSPEAKAKVLRLRAQIAAGEI